MTAERWPRTDNNLLSRTRSSCEPRRDEASSSSASPSERQLVQELAADHPFLVRPGIRLVVDHFRGNTEQARSFSQGNRAVAGIRRACEIERNALRRKVAAEHFLKHVLRGHFRLLVKCHKLLHRIWPALFRPPLHVGVRGVPICGLQVFDWCHPLPSKLICPAPLATMNSIAPIIDRFVTR
jgi:hypothetical protein